MKTHRRFAAATLLALGAFGSPVQAQDGYADTTFDDDGLQVIGWAGDWGAASAVRAANDGSLWVGGNVLGSFSQDFGVTRLRANGTLDLTWGSVGRRRVAVDAVTDASDRLLALAPLADGSLLLAGLSMIDSDNFLELPAVAKLTPGGDLDTSFGDSGVATLDLPWATSSWGWQGALAQPDGKILFFGYCYDCPDNGADARPMLLRVTSSGAPDPTFSGDGWEAPSTGAWSTTYPYDVRLDGADRILVLGQDGSFSITRLTAAGALDTTFGGGDGIASFAMPAGHAYPYNLAVDPNDGSMYVAMSFMSGPYDQHGGVIRLSSAGVRDAAYAGDGLAELLFGLRLTIWSMEAQSDGRPVGVGWIEASAGNADFLLFRLEPSGALDTTFHADGVRRVLFGQVPDGHDLAFAMTFSGGRLVAVGRVAVGTETRYGITRATSRLIFTDGFERGTTSGWGSH